MRAMRVMCASMVAWGLCLGPSRVFAQENPQALRQEIDQLRRDFDALKQQYGDRLTALEGKLAAAEGAGGAWCCSAGCRATVRGDRSAGDRAGAARRGGRRRSKPARCRCTAARSPASKVFNPDIAVIGDFLVPRHATA